MFLFLVVVVVVHLVGVRVYREVEVIEYNRCGTMRWDKVEEERRFERRRSTRRVQTNDKKNEIIVVAESCCVLFYVCNSRTDGLEAQEDEVGHKKKRTISTRRKKRPWRKMQEGKNGVKPEEGRKGEKSERQGTEMTIYRISYLTNNIVARWKLIDNREKIKRGGR